MNIGLTGGIATGKSTVSAMLVQHGALLIDVDQIAREVVLPGSPTLLTIFEHFGQALRMEDGSLNRKKLGEIIFSDPNARKELEAIIHPPIRLITRERMYRYETEQPNHLVVVDVPLLFESGHREVYKQVLLVYAPYEVQITRLMKRDHIDRAKAQLRIDAQMPIEEKRKLADIVIDNSGPLEQTRLQVENFLQGKGLQ